MALSRISATSPSLFLPFKSSLVIWTSILSPFIAPFIHELGINTSFSSSFSGIKKPNPFLCTCNFPVINPILSGTANLSFLVLTISPSFSIIFKFHLKSVYSFWLISKTATSSWISIGLYASSLMKLNNVSFIPI